MSSSGVSPCVGYSAAPTLPVTPPPPNSSAATPARRRPPTAAAGAIAAAAPTLDGRGPGGKRGRAAGDTSGAAYEQHAHVAGPPCHPKEHGRREARAASPAGLTERLPPGIAHHPRPAGRGHPPQGPDD